MRTGDSWRPFGIGPEDFDDVPAGHDGIKIIHLGAGGGHVRSDT